MVHSGILLYGNISTAMAYFVLTIQIISFVRNPKFMKLIFHRAVPRDRIHGDLYISLLAIICLYSSFIFLCGSTHFMTFIHYYYPKSLGVVYAQSVSIISCAVVSVLTAVASFRILPIILNNLDKFEFTHEWKLQHHDNYLLEAVEMIKESIVILSPDLKIVRGNQASKLIFGISSQETSILNCIHHGDKTMFLDSVGRVMGSYNFTPSTVEIRVRRDPAMAIPALIPTIPSSPISNRPPISPSNNRRRNSHTRVYCADDSASRRSAASAGNRSSSQSISQSLRSRSHSNSSPSEDDGYMWIECTLCKGARMSAVGNFDYDLKMVSRNIDDRKKQAQYQSLVESTEEKARTNEAKMRYISCIAHDLKTPLQSFSFTMDLLGQTRLLGEQKDYLQQATVAVDLMRLTISQTMDISKALTGAKLMPRRTTVHLSSVLQRVGVIIRGYGKQVPVSFEVAKDVCDTIITDEEWLWQMMLNLLTNACKYTDKGEIAMKLSVVRDFEDDLKLMEQGEGSTERTSLELPIAECSEAILCEVVDTGVGVREDKLATLFDAFSQVQDGQVTGTGLGLFGVRTRAEGLGGSCGARRNTQSSTGTGTVIWFSIPYVPDRSFSQSGSTKFIFEDLTPTDISPKGCDYQQPFAFSADTEGEEFFPVTSMDESGLRVEEAIRARQLTAMVVEDSRVVRKLMERVLLKMGFARVECYENGSKGLEAMMAQQVDIVFSDVQMPIMTGPEMVSRFRKFEAEALGAGRRSRRQVVVAVTANGSECGDHQDFDDLCPKPVNRTDIYHIVNKHMSDFSGNARTEETVLQE